MNEGEERSLQRKATTAERRRERLPFPVQPARRLLIANNLITRVADRQRCQKRKRLVIPPAAIPLPRGSADGYPKSRARFPRPSRGGEHTTTESKAGNCCPQRDSCQPSTAPRKKELFCLPRPAAQGRYVPSPTKQGASALALPGLPAPSRVVPGQLAGADSPKQPTGHRPPPVAAIFAPTQARAPQPQQTHQQARRAPPRPPRTEAHRGGAQPSSSSLSLSKQRSTKPHSTYARRQPSQKRSPRTHHVMQALTRSRPACSTSHESMPFSVSTP